MGKKKKRNFNERSVKRECPLEKAGIVEVDYKDIELLRMFVTTKGKIIPRRISGLSARSQTRITGAIKRARNAGLLSFAEGFVGQDDEQHEQSQQRR